MLQMLLMRQGMDEANQKLGKAYDTARGDLTGPNPYQPTYDAAFGDKGSLEMLRNALGLNGPEGASAATAAFQGGPGYQFKMDQGLQALDRSAAARGMLGSGNNSIDTIKYAQGVADQGWQDWENRLGGMTTLGQTAAGGLADTNKSLAALDYGYGKDLSGIAMGGTQAAISGLTSGMQADAASGAQRSNNLLGSILGGVKMGASLLAAPMTGGTSLFGLLGGAGGGGIPGSDLTQGFGPWSPGWN